MINELVKKLSNGQHEVTIGNRGEFYSEIQERLIDIKYIHVTFLNTKGSTELGINVDIDVCNLKNVDFEKGVGKVHIEGATNLNCCNVRCVADIDLKTKKGKGALVVIK